MCHVSYFSGDDGDLWNSSLSEGKQQLGSVAYDSVVLLVCAWEEAGNVLKRQQGDVEGVAETDKPSALHRGVDVQASYVMEKSSLNPLSYVRSFV